MSYRPDPDRDKRISQKMIDAGARALASFDGHKIADLIPKGKHRYEGAAERCLKAALNPANVSQNWTDKESDEKAAAEQKKREAQRKAERDRLEEARKRMEARKAEQEREARE